ncbi:hypothetical protein F4776DRAFT_675979 [Hypoxylon sp. NC0597]|nr:hypothetical protein F4776DRAFT_675979 [Hypoxylon sp. NC0597]
MSLDDFKSQYKPRRPPAGLNRSGEPPQPWTTARCHRLLRPLLSRVASLRKEATASLLNAKGDEFERETRACAEQQNSSYDWLGPRKRIRLTYSQKRPPVRQGEGSTSGKSSGEPGISRCLRQGEGRTMTFGEIVAATPLLRRARGHVVPSPTVPSSLREEHEQPRIACKRDSRLKRGPAKHRDFDQRLAKLRADSASNRYNDLEAIYRSLDVLLKATRHESNVRKGPRSFLDICLRKVPQYIEALEAQERMDAEQNGTKSTLDDVHTSAEVYNYLEAIGSNPALGWKHLRVVVRADGINVVKQGISEGLFGDDFSELLIDLCVQAGALSEAEELVAALVDRQYPRPTRPDSSFSELASLRPLSVLWTFASKHNRTPFLLRQYTLLLSNYNLPQDWLATREFERIWALAARCLSVVEAADDAVAFMSHSISLLCRRKRTVASGPDASSLEKDISMANKQTLISALTMLAAMSSVGEIELQSPSVSEAEIAKISLIGNRLRYILRSCIADSELSKFTRSNLGSDLLYLALFFSSNSARNNDDIRSRVRNGIEQAWRQNINPRSTEGNRTKHRVNDIASFVSSVARSCGRGMSVASHSCLDRLFNQLENLELEREILDSMKAVAAFSLAQQTNNVKDFIYAEKLASNQCSVAGGDARSLSLFTGYRWEETIGEWVTASPVVKRQRPQTKARQLRSSSRIEINQNDSGAEHLDTQSGGPKYDEADSVPGPEIERAQGGRKGQGLLAVGAERVNTKKRAHSCSQDDKPRGVALRSTKSASSFVLDDELSSNKENRNHAAGKKPRRSVDRRTVLGSKPRSSLAGQINTSMLGDASSDDELCM